MLNKILRFYVFIKSCVNRYTNLSDNKEQQEKNIFKYYLLLQ